MTYPLWQKSVAGTIASAIAERDLLSGWFRAVVNDYILSVIANKHLPEAQQVRIRANELNTLVEQCVLVNDVLAEEVAELEKLVHRRSVAEELLHTFEKGDLILSRS